MGAAGFQKGGEAVARKRTREAEDFRLDPEARMCPKFDAVSVTKFPVAPREKMGVRVEDNCAEEHIM